MRRTVYQILDPRRRRRGARLFRVAHHALIVLGVAAMVADTVPSVGNAHPRLLAAAFTIPLALFAAEYLLRLYAAPEAPWAQKDREWQARRHFAISLHGIIDLVALSPLVALAIDPDDLTDASLLGVLWLLKLVPYSDGLALLGRVIRNAGTALSSVLLGFSIILLTAGTIAYLAERMRQPDAFGSIPSALWWAVTTLTTTGYGDEVPATIVGRLLGGAVMIAGIGIFALLAGILASGFAEELRRREFLRTWDLVARVPYFRDVGAETIAEVTRLLRPREFPAGTTLMRRGEPGDCMYFVVEGEIEVQIQPRPLRLGPGTFVGEIALITGGPRMATAVTARPCVLLELDLVDFRTAGRRPDLTRIIDAEAARRLSEAKARG